MATASEVCGFCSKEPVFGSCKNCSMLLGETCFAVHSKVPGHITFQLDGSNKLANNQEIRKKDKCKDSIVDRHDVRVEEHRANELLTKLCDLEEEICAIEKRVEENVNLNDECKEAYIHAIEAYNTELKARLDQLVTKAKHAGQSKHSLNADNLMTIDNKCKERKRRIEELKQLVQDESEKKHERQLYIISKRLEKELQEINAIIRQCSLENHIVKFSFEKNSELQTFLQTTIQEIGTLQEVCEGSDELVEKKPDKQPFSLQPPGLFSQLPPGPCSLQPPGLFSQLPRGLFSQLPPGLFSQLPPGLFSQLPRGLFSQLPPGPFSLQPPRIDTESDSDDVDTESDSDDVDTESDSS